MKTFLSASAVVILLSCAAIAQDNPSTITWYAGEFPDGPGRSQDLRFDVHGRYERPVTSEKLMNARRLRDFIPGYPVNWITDYVSVEILATCNGKTKKASSSNEALTMDQINMLRTIDPGTEIITNVKYTYKNPVTDQPGDFNAHISMMAIPETEAEYSSGRLQLRKYLMENVIDKFTENIRESFQQAIVVFTVSESGEIVNTKISKSSGNSKSDKIMLDAITRMPKWKPAKNSKGINVKQEFEFSVGSGGC